MRTINTNNWIRNNRTNIRTNNRNIINNTHAAVSSFGVGGI